MMTTYSLGVHSHSWRDTMVSTATEILSRMSVLEQLVANSSSSSTTAGGEGKSTGNSSSSLLRRGRLVSDPLIEKPPPLNELVSNTKKDIQEMLQGLVSQLPLEGAEDDAWLSKLLASRGATYINATTGRGGVGPKMKLSSTAKLLQRLASANETINAEESSSLLAPSSASASPLLPSRAVGFAQHADEEENGIDDDGSIDWMAAAVRQRLSELHVQLSNSKSMLRIARAKIQRRNMVLEYIQQTLHRELLYFKEQYLKATEQPRETLKDMDVGVFSFMDFLELLEDPVGGGNDSETGGGGSDKADDLDFDETLSSDPVERKRRLAERKKINPAKVDLVAELAKRWKHEQKETESRESTMKDAFGVLQEKCGEFEKQLNGMTTRYAEDTTKLRTQKTTLERKLHTTNTDLAYALGKLNDVTDTVDARNDTIKALNDKCGELENLVSLLRLTADTDAAHAKENVSAQEAKLNLERQRVQKVLERLASRGLEIPPDLLSGNEEDDDDPMVMETLRSAQSMNEMKDQLAAAQSQLAPMAEELKETKEKKEEMERGVETALRLFKKLGVEPPDDLKPFRSILGESLDDDGPDGNDNDPSLAAMKLSLERSKALSQVEDLLELLQRSQEKLRDFGKEIQDTVAISKSSGASDGILTPLRSPMTPSIDTAAPQNKIGLTLLTPVSMSVVSEGGFDLKEQKNSESGSGSYAAAHNQSVRNSLSAPPPPGRNESTVTESGASAIVNLDDKVLAEVQSFEELVASLDHHLASVSAKVQKDSSDRDKFRNKISEQRTEMNNMKVQHKQALSRAVSEHSESQPNTARKNTADASCQVEEEASDLSSPSSRSTTANSRNSGAVPAALLQIHQEKMQQQQEELQQRIEAAGAAPVDTRTRWAQTDFVETESTKTQTDALPDQLNETVKAVQEYMDLLEGSSSGGSPLKRAKTGSLNQGAGGRVSSSSFLFPSEGGDLGAVDANGGATPAIMPSDPFAWMDQRLLCDQCGASLRPQSLATVKFESTGCGPDLVDLERIRIMTKDNVEVQTDDTMLSLQMVRAREERIGSASSTRSSAQSRAFERRQTALSNAVSGSQASFSQPGDHDILEDHQIDSLSNLSSAQGGKGSKPSSSVIPTQTEPVTIMDAARTQPLSRPQSVAELRRLSSASVGAGGGIIPPAGSQPLIRPDSAASSSLQQQHQYPEGMSSSQMAYHHQTSLGGGGLQEAQLSEIHPILSTSSIGSMNAGFSPSRGGGALILVEEIGVQVDPSELEPPMQSDIPTVGSRRHLSSATTRQRPTPQQRLRSAGTMSTRSSSGFGDDDDVSWSTEIPSRPASGFAGANKRGKDGGDKGGLPPALTGQSVKRATTSLGGKRKAGLNQLTKKSQSPPPPMFHHHFPASKKPSIKECTPEEEEKIKESFEKEFGLPLVEYKQLKTKKRQMLLLPPASGKPRSVTNREPRDLTDESGAKSLLAIELKGAREQKKLQQAQADPDLLLLTTFTPNNPSTTTPQVSGGATKAEDP